MKSRRSFRTFVGILFSPQTLSIILYQSSGHDTPNSIIGMLLRRPSDVYPLSKLTVTSSIVRFVNVSISLATPSSIETVIVRLAIVRSRKTSMINGLKNCFKPLTFAVTETLFNGSDKFQMIRKNYEFALMMPSRIVTQGRHGSVTRTSPLALTNLRPAYFCPEGRLIVAADFTST